MDIVGFCWVGLIVDRLYWRGRRLRGFHLPNILAGAFKDLQLRLRRILRLGFAGLMDGRLNQFDINTVVGLWRAVGRQAAKHKDCQRQMKQGGSGWTPAQVHKILVRKCCMG